MVFVESCLIELLRLIHTFSVDRGVLSTQCKWDIKHGPVCALRLRVCHILIQSMFHLFPDFFGNMDPGLWRTFGVSLCYALSCATIAPMRDLSPRVSFDLDCFCSLLWKGIPIVAIRIELWSLILKVMNSKNNQKHANILQANRRIWWCGTVKHWILMASLRCTRTFTAALWNENIAKPQHKTSTVTQKSFPDIFDFSLCIARVFVSYSHTNDSVIIMPNLYVFTCIGNDAWRHNRMFGKLKSLVLSEL